MNQQSVLDITVKAIWVSIKIASPALLATLFTGLVVSIFQAATQINEQTLSFIPKILAMTAALVFFGPWIIETMMVFTKGIISQIPTFIGR